MINKKLSRAGKKVRVTFELPADAVEEQAAVVGDFNDWDPKANPMKYVKSRKVWSTAVSFEPGDVCQFRYYVDGAWRNDEDADRHVWNEHGTENSVLDLHANGDAA